MLARPQGCMYSELARLHEAVADAVKTAAEVCAPDLLLFVGERLKTKRQASPESAPLTKEGSSSRSDAAECVRLTQALDAAVSAALAEQAVDLLRYVGKHLCNRAKADMVAAACTSPATAPDLDLFERRTALQQDGAAAASPARRLHRVTSPADRRPSRRTPLRMRATEAGASLSFEAAGGARSLDEPMAHAATQKTTPLAKLVPMPTQTPTQVPTDAPTPMCGGERRGTTQKAAVEPTTGAATPTVFSGGSDSTPDQAVSRHVATSAPRAAAASSAATATGTVLAQPRAAPTVLALEPNGAEAGGALSALSKLDDRLIDVLYSGDIKLIRASWLREQPPAYQIERRQDLEVRRSTPSPLLSPEEAVQLLKRCDRSVGVLSYGWLLAGHPDPEGVRMTAVRRALEAEEQIEGLFWEYARAGRSNVHPHPRNPCAC